MPIRLSLEELMDLADNELDAIEAGERFADTTTWLAVMSFVERVQKIGTPPPPRNREGFISDAEDILHDIESKDIEEYGQLTLSEVETIRRMIAVHGCCKEWVARQLQLTVDQIDEALTLRTGSSQ